MVKKAAEMPTDVREQMRGGEGAVTLIHAFSAEDWGSPTRLFSKITLPPGASVGFHVHEGEEEFYFFTAGEAEYSDNGATISVRAGDATLTKDGEGHSVKNTGSVPVEFIAAIVRYAG